MSDLFQFQESDAVISDCGKYRYLLRRTWDAAKLRALLVMLNPSTADAENNDPTIKSCIRLCSGLGYGSFEVVNLYAWRSTDPSRLGYVADPVGRDNNRTILSAIERCDIPICAWGKNAGPDRAREVWQTIKSRRPAIFCFGTNKNGTPKHPLYIKSGTALVKFDGKAAGK